MYRIEKMSENILKFKNYFFSTSTTTTSKFDMMVCW